MKVFLHPIILESKLTAVNTYFIKKDNFGSGSSSQIISAPQHWAEAYVFLMNGAFVTKHLSGIK